MAGFKKGRMTRAECDYVRSNRYGRSAAEMSADLNRSPAMVANELSRMDEELAAAALRAARPKRQPRPKAEPPPAPTAAEEEGEPLPAEIPGDGGPDPDEADAPPRPKWGKAPRLVVESEARARFRSDLKAGVGWARLRKELEEDEQQLFADRYVALMEQFKDDVLATEDSQMFKAIKYEVFLGRTAVKLKAVSRELRAIERAQDHLGREIARKRLAHLDVAPEMELLLNYQQESQSLAAHHKSLVGEYTSLDEKHQRLLQDLKGTRQQRIDKIESGKISFLGLIKGLQDAEVADRAGRQNEQMKRAAAKELARLAAPHTYGDGVEDLPVLNADTVLLNP